MASHVTLWPPSGDRPSPARSVVIPHVAVRDKLTLRFEARQGKPLLSGVRLTKRASGKVDLQP